MAYRTILVHCDDSAQGERRLRYAERLAEVESAKIVGLWVSEPPPRPPYVETPFVVDLGRMHESQQAARAAAAREVFDRIVSAPGISGEWRTEIGDPRDALIAQLRYADLGIVGQYDGDSPFPEHWRTVPQDVAMACGRPLLVVPFIGAPKSVGEHVLVAWDAGREATRAVSDALPLLRRAKRVTVLVVDPHPGRDGHGDEPGADVAAWLARHDVRVTVQRDRAANTDIGELILSRITDFGVDLAVMGLFGHSRLREMVLGGVSRTMLASMTVPLLIAH
jgi:nucleotide-binding universal stress UspA family protein